MAPSRTPSIAILAGGLATRMGEITANVPKALLPVAGQPFLAHQLALLRSNGFTDFVLCLGHFGEQIEEAFGTGDEHGVTLQYSYDGDKLLGTGGALSKALPMLGDAFGVLYGDSYLPIDYQAACKAFYESRQPSLMTVYENRDQYDTSNVLFDAGKLLRYSKSDRTPEMRHIDYGLSFFRKDVFNAWPDDERFDLSEVQAKLSEDEQLAGYLVEQRFYEIGSPQGLAELDEILTEKKQTS